MKVGLLNDDLDQHAVGILLERDEEIGGEFFRVLDQLGRSWTDGIVSIIGPSSSQISESAFHEFTDHLQNYASKENKWITSSVPIRRNSSSGSFTIQIINKNSSSEKAQGQLTKLTIYDGNLKEKELKKISNVIVLVDREFERKRQDDAQFYLVNILRERLALEFAVFNGDIDALSFLHEIALNGFGKLVLVEDSGGIINYLVPFLFNQKRKINMEERFSYRTRLQNESGDFPKMIMDLKAHQSTSRSIQLYQNLSQFFIHPLENAYDIGDLCSQIFSSPFFYISEEQVFNALEVAMSRNEIEVVELIHSRFSSEDLDQREFASPGRLETLYLSQINLVKEESLADRAGLRDTWKSKTFDKDQSARLSRLIEDFESSLISTNWNPFARRYKNRTAGKYHSKSKGLKESFESHDAEERLFCWAMLFEYWDLANLIWLRSKYGISMALVGANFLRGAAGLKQRDISASERLQEFAKYYENAAIDAYSDVPKSSLIGEQELSPQLMLVSANERMGNMTMLKLASSGKCVNFIAQVGVQEFLSNIWRGKFALKEKMASIALCIFFFWLPFLPSLILNFKEKTSASWVDKWIYTMKAPLTVFWMNMISYFLYIIFFATFLLRFFCIIPTWLDWLLIFWTFTLFVEEIRQMFVADDSLQRGRFGKWWDELYNKFDAASELSFIAGAVLKLTAPETKFSGEQECPTEISGQLFAAQACFAFSFMFMAYRSLIVFDVSRDLGPKVIMIWKMFFQMFQFLLIMAIFILTYGIVQQSLQYPNEHRYNYTIKNILFGAYYAIYGELFLGERTTYDFEDQPEECIPPGDIVGNSTFPRCPSKTVISDIFHGTYMIIANILLLNLLIALFSSTYAAIDENSIRIWKFSRYQTVKNNYFRPILPPPFIIFSHVYNIFLYCKNGFQVNNNNSKFRYHEWTSIDPKMPGTLDELEAKQTRSHIHGMKSFRRQEIDGPLTKTFFEKEIHRRLDSMELALKKTFRNCSLSNHDQ